MRNQAISLYKEALEEDVKGEQHLLRGQINTLLYYQLIFKNDSNSMKYAETALEDYNRYGDPEFIIEGQINIGYGLSLLDQNSAAIEMLKEALAGAEKERISFSCSKIHKVGSINSKIRVEAVPQDSIFRNQSLFRGLRLSKVFVYPLIDMLFLTI